MLKLRNGKCDMRYWFKLQGLTDEDTRRLTVELQRTMDMYHAACKEAIMAKQTVLYDVSLFLII